VVEAHDRGLAKLVLSSRARIAAPIVLVLELGTLSLQLPQLALELSKLGNQLSGTFAAELDQGETTVEGRVSRRSAIERFGARNQAEAFETSQLALDLRELVVHPSLIDTNLLELSLVCRWQVLILTRDVEAHPHIDGKRCRSVGICSLDSNV
jgi:hypothetical protein